MKHPRFPYHSRHFKTLSLLLLLLLPLLLPTPLHAQSDPTNMAAIDDIVVSTFDLPVTYDLRAAGVLSPVRTQSTGGCWSSSVMATVEPWMRITGVGDFLLSDRHLQLTHGFDDSRNTYGNHYMATAYFSRGAGPVVKNAGLDSIPQPRPGIPFILDGARYLPGDPGLVKQAILDYGPVYTMLYFKRKDVDTSSFIMRNPENPRNYINHAAVLVGWNDTLTTMEGTGAWILQNSLGSSFGDHGFFYVPYGNEDILKHNAVWNAWKPFGEDNRILYYDTLGSFESYGFNDSVCYGLTRFTAAEDSRVIRLATHINNPGTSVGFAVYTDFDPENKALSGKLAETEETYCMFPGYYTVELQEGVDIPAGKDFYVMARYVAPYSTQPLPVEHAIEDYSGPHIMDGTNWVNPDAEKWPQAWYGCGPGSPYPALDFDLCIRAVIELIKN